MAVPIKILVTFILTFTISVVNSPPTARDLHPSRNASVPNAKADAKDVLNVLRKRREAVRGHGCPKRKILYFGKCRTYKELEDEIIASTTKTDPSYSTTATVPNEKHIEPMPTDDDLSVVALITSAVTTKRSEPRVRATQQIANATEPNLSVQPLETMAKPKLSDTELNPIHTKVTNKLTPNLVLKDPKLIMKTSNRELRTIVWTQPLPVVMNVTTAMPSRVKQEPHLLKNNPDLSVMSKATSTKTNIKYAVSQSNVVTGSVVTQQKHMTDLNNAAEKVPFKNKSGRTTLITEPVSVEAKQKPTATHTPLVTDPNPVVSESATGADEVTLSATDVTSTPVLVDMDPTVKKIKDIATTVTVAETSYTEKTNPLPTGTRFSEAESGSSTTTVDSRKISIPYFLYIFIYALEAMTWRCALILVGIGVIVLIFIYVRKYKKLKKCNNGEEVFEKKLKEIVTSE